MNIKLNNNTLYNKNLNYNNDKNILLNNKDLENYNNSNIKSNLMNERKKTYLNKDQHCLIKEAFDLFDINKKGSIDLYELNLTLKALKFKFCKEEINEIITTYNIENNKILFDDYIDILTNKFNQRNPKEEALMAFNLFDEDKTGKIGYKQLKKCIKDLDENITDIDLKCIIEEFDTDGDGFITKNEFIDILDEYYFD